MATVVTWRLNLKEIEIGKEVEFTAEGLAPFEGMAVLIQRPDGSDFIWGVQSDADGKVRETIKLDSGLGQYIFCPRPECGNVIPHCLPLNVCPCIRSSSNCNIRVTGPDRILSRSAHVFLVSGLRPGYKVTAKAASVSQVTSQENLIADANGELRFEFSWGIIGQYALTFSDGDCISAPFIVDVVEDPNYPIGIGRQSADDCSAPIEIKTKFNKGSYQINETGTLRVSISNLSSQSRTISIQKFFALGDAIITSDTLPNALVIPGYTTQSYLIFFVTGPSDKILAGTITANYYCNELPFGSNGSAFSAIVGVGEGVCNGVLQFFGAADGETNVDVAAPVDLSFEIVNYGNSPITDVKISALDLPDNVTLNTPLPLTGGPIAPGAVLALTASVTMSEGGTFTIHMPANSISYRCGVANDWLTISQQGFVTFVAS